MHLKFKIDENNMQEIREFIENFIEWLVYPSYYLITGLFIALLIIIYFFLA